MNLAYIKLTMKSFKQASIYKSNVVNSVIRSLLQILIHISLWTALYNNRNVNVVTLNQAFTYTILNILLFKQMYIYISNDIGSAIYDGSIELYLFKPFSMTKIFAFSAFGKSLFKFIFYSLPIIIVFLFLKKIIFPSNLFEFLFFIISFFLGHCIFLIIECLLGYTAFWLKTNWYIIWLQITLMGFFGGSIIPIWFYPETLSRICSILPFQYISFVPIKIYTERFQLSSNLKLIFFQIIWIILLYQLKKVMLKKSLLKLEISGG